MTRKKKNPELERKFLSNLYWKNVPYDYFEGDINELITKLNVLLKEASKESFTKISFEFDWYYEDLTVRVKGDRFESDEEYNARLEYINNREIDEAKKKKKAEQAEYTKYLRLKKKYEGKE